MTLPVAESPPDDGINPKTGEPNGIDKGWGYMPGDTVSDTTRVIADKLRALPAPLGAAMMASWTPEAIDGLTEAFGKWVDEIIVDGKERGRSMVVGAIKPKWIDRLHDLGADPQTAEMTVTDRDVIHTFRPDKVAPLERDFFRQLPKHLRDPDAVIIDQTHDRPALLLVFNLPADRRRKLVLQLDYTLKSNRTKTVTNVLNTGRIVDRNDLNQPKYTVVEGNP